jgi:hypothetical protein
MPPCECIPTEFDVVITNHCLLHNPADGLLVKHPVQFTGLLGILKTADVAAQRP